MDAPDGVNAKLNLRAELENIRESLARRGPAEQRQTAMMAHRLSAFSTKPR